MFADYCGAVDIYTGKNCTEEAQSTIHGITLDSYKMGRVQFRKWNIALTGDDTTTLLCRIPGCLYYCVIAPSCRIPGAHMMVWELPCCRIPGAPHFARSFIISLLLPGAGGAGLSCAAGEKTTLELQLNTSPPPPTQSGHFASRDMCRYETFNVWKLYCSLFIHLFISHRIIMFMKIVVAIMHKS